VPLWLAAEQGSSLLYGEILPAGLSAVMDDHHLRGNEAMTVFDLGRSRQSLKSPVSAAFVRATVCCDVSWLPYDCISLLWEWMA